MVIKMASTERKPPNAHGLPYESLEEFHVYMLANILRRPIIVMAHSMWHDLQGNSLQPQNFSGVYLPLRWTPEECSKHPIILGYYQMHFVPLVYTGVMDGETAATDFVAPLIVKDHNPLPIHFLTEEEAAKEDQLLHDYLTIEEIPHMDSDESLASTHVIKGAALSTQIPPDDINLMTSYFKLVESHYRYYLETEYNPQGALQGGAIPNSDITSQNEDKISKMNATSQVPQGSDMWTPPTNPNYKSSTSGSNVQQGNASNELPKLQDSAKNPERIMSMINQSCKTKGCQYYRSISTGEYCHECYSKLKATGEIKDDAGKAKCRTEGCLNFSEPGQEHCQVCQASAKFHDNMGPTAAPSAPLPSNVLYPGQQAGNNIIGNNQQTAKPYQSVHVSSGNDDDLTTLMVNTQKVGSKKCVMPECQLTGHPAMSDMCQKCFEENRRIHEDVMSQAGTARIEHPALQKPMAQNSAPSRAVYTSTTRQCRTLGCQGLANSQLGYLCGGCHLNLSPGTAFEKPNQTPSIPPPNYDQALRLLQSNPAAAQMPQPNQASGYSDPNEQQQLPVLTVQKHICATPGCQGIRLEGGYCHDCVIKNRLTTNPSRTQTPPPTPKQSWVRSEPRAQTPPMTSSRQMQSSGLGYPSRNPPAPSSPYRSHQQAAANTVPLSHLSTRTCRHPRCDRPAAPPKYILCEECIQIAELYKKGENGEQQRPSPPPATWSGEDQGKD